MPTPTPQSKASMDPNFETRLRELMLAARAEAASRSVGGQVRWQRPGGWPGDPFDVEAMSPPFSREAANADFLSAVADPDAPGTTGDVVATTTMIDYLSAMERAFRARFVRRPRAVSHMLGRKTGHGSQTGPFMQNGVEYVRGILKQSKVAQ